jgi:DNA repair exonuclease SbcCD ATPase subunit
MARFRKPTRDELNRWAKVDVDRYLETKEWAAQSGLQKGEKDYRRQELYELVELMREHYGADTPLEKYEQQAARAEALREQLENLQYDLEENEEEHQRLLEEIAEMEKEAERAERMSVPFKARIGTLHPDWQKEWVRTYDMHREENLKGKSEAAALAWAAIKVHCFKDGDDWACPPHKDVFGKKATSKKKASKKKASKKKASKKKAAKKKATKKP